MFRNYSKELAMHAATTGQQLLDSWCNASTRPVSTVHSRPPGSHGSKSEILVCPAPEVLCGDGGAGVRDLVKGRRKTHELLSRSPLILCSRCPQGRFNAVFSVSHLFECTPCQANEITLENTSLSSASDCICDAGRLRH